jgi:uncharacterized membrane protein (UPF0127 family)
VAASASLDSDAGSSSDATGALRVESSGAAVAPFTGLTEAQLGVDGDCKRIVVADALAERVAGLRGRTELDPYDGMLFVFGGPTTSAFTMSGVSAPLDIGFYDGDGRPVSRLRMEPCDEAEAECPSYLADGPFEYALETEVGELESGALTNCPS